MKVGNYAVTLIVTDNYNLNSAPTQKTISVQKPPTVTVDPRLSSSPPNTEFKVNVTVAYVAKLAKWVFNMTFDPNVLNASEVIEGPFLKEAGITTFTREIDNTRGFVFASAWLSNLPSNGVNGSGTLSTITFQVEANGTIPLHLEKETQLFTAMDGNFVAFYSVNVDGQFEYPPAFAPPDAIFTYSPKYPLVNQVVTFDATASKPNGGYIKSYFWDFGDNTNTTETSPITYHRYTAIGTYNVTLTVTDSDDLNGTTWKLIKIVQPPEAAFTYKPERPIVNEMITFNASASKPKDDSIISYFWNFGDTNTSNETSPITTHAYTTFGNFNISLTVTNSDFQNNTTWKLIKILQPPTANFTYNPAVGIVGQIIRFNSTSYDPDGFIKKWEWDLNSDGIIDATTENATYIYTEKGNYRVRLKVTDNDTLTHTTTKDITVLLHDIAIIGVTTNLNTAKIGQSISISVAVVNNGDFAETFNVAIYYSSNVIKTFEAITLDAGSDTVLTATWETTQVNAGIYTITATATHVDGEANISNNTYEGGQVTIKALEAPMASFTYLPSRPKVGETVTFNASASSDPDGTITSYTWNFGDGSTITEPDPIITHTYTNAQEYTVTLTVTDDDSKTHMMTQTIIVEEAPKEEGAPTISMYALAGFVTILAVVIVIALYFLKFRKSKST
jgi:PKD repeat protein